MSLWIALGVMTLAAAVFVALPLWRRPSALAPRSAYDLEIYRDQLAEIDREAERGLLTPEQAEAARTEVGRRAIAAANDDSTADAPPRVSRGTVAVAAVFVAVVSAAIYTAVGSPGVTGRAPAPRADAANSNINAVVAKLARRMEQTPKDVEGWRLLGRTLTTLGRYGEAIDAYRRAVALRPNDAGLRSSHGEAIAMASSRVITPTAEAAFKAALTIDPKEPRARFYLGLAELQAGRRREALDRWRALEAESPPDAPWLPILRPRIDRLAKQLGVDVAGRGGAATPKATSQATSPPSEGAAMIRSMVDRLAARLERTPDDFEGWMRLGRSYGVLRKPAKSRDAYAKAAALRPKEPRALAGYAGALAMPGAGGNADLKLDRVLSRLLDLDPENFVGLWLAGGSAQRAGRIDEARRHWARLLARLPEGTRRHADLKARIAALGGVKTP